MIVMYANKEKHLPSAIHLQAETKQPNSAEKYIISSILFHNVIL